MGFASVTQGESWPLRAVAAGLNAARELRGARRDIRAGGSALGL